MNHTELYQLRKSYLAEALLLCFNGPFSQGLIEEIGNALKKYLQSQADSSSSALDVFSVYVEIAQNIQHYAAAKNYNENDATATVAIGRDENGHYTILAGNIIEAADGPPLVAYIDELAAMDKTQLKALYREQLRKPRDETSCSAGLGLIHIARKACTPFSCSLQPVDDPAKYFFSLHVVI